MVDSGAGLEGFCRLAVKTAVKTVPAKTGFCRQNGKNCRKQVFAGKNWQKQVFAGKNSFWLAGIIKQHLIALIKEIIKGNYNVISFINTIKYI